GLKFVRDLPADVSKFDGELAVELALNGKVELMAHAGPEIGVESLAGACCNFIDGGVVGLAERLAGDGQWRYQTLPPARSGAEAGNRWGGATAPAPAGAIRQGTEALHRLDQAGTQQRNEHKTGAVQSSVKNAVAAAHYGFVYAENVAQQS